MSEIYFTSDIHYGHENIMKYCNRPFKSVQEMNDTIVENWNNKVTDDDLVYIVGDIAIKGKMAREFFERTNGKKSLVIGNHDTIPNAAEYLVGYDIYKIVDYKGKKISMCHYPSKDIMEASLKVSDYFVYGHVHNTYERTVYNRCKELVPRVLNAGMDVNNFVPVSLDEMIEANLNFFNNNLNYFEREVREI